MLILRCRTFPFYKSHMLPFYRNTYFPPPPAPPQPLATTNNFPISIILSFQECYINGVTQYMTFWDWPFSLSVILSVSSRLLVYQYLIPFYCWRVFYGCISLLNHLPVEEYLDCFQFLTVMNKVSINIHVQVFVWL